MKRSRLAVWLLAVILCVNMVPAVVMAEETADDPFIVYDEPELEITDQEEAGVPDAAEDLFVEISEDLPDESGSVDAASAAVSNATAYKTRLAEKEKASDGNAFVTVRGTFYKVSKDTVLKRLNEIRYEACKEGVINPETGKKLTKKDYVPIKWSSDLEWIAQTRAAEASVVMDHQRPNGTWCFSCTHNGEETWAEDLAWNYSGMMQGIEQWYSEKDDWVNQNSSAVTGHYTSMINPSYYYVALGCFRKESGGWYSVSGEFSFMSGLDETQSGVSGPYDQVIEVPKDQKADFREYQGSAASLFGAKVTGLSAQTYTGEKITPVPTVKVGSKLLKKGTDYTVKYKKNKSVGTATVLILGKGAYAGVVVKTFRINPQGAYISKLQAGEKRFKVTWVRKGTLETKVEIQYSLVNDFSTKTSKTISDTSVTSKTFTDLKSGKKYYVRVRTKKTVGGKTYYSAWSKVKTVTVK